ncbi:MAG: hypothetical protein ACU84Q_21165 [Gammaproteobacteria bacterium]
MAHKHKISVSMHWAGDGVPKLTAKDLGLAAEQIIKLANKKTLLRFRKIELYLRARFKLRFMAKSQPSCTRRLPRLSPSSIA